MNRTMMRHVITQLGRPVSLTHDGQTVQVDAVVQSTRKSRDAIVNAYGDQGWTVQIHAADLAFEPERFDTVEDNEGWHLVVDLVETKRDSTGTPWGYFLHGEGR